MQCCASRSRSRIQGIFDPWIRDPGWAKNQVPDPGFGCGVNILKHTSDSLETIFWVKIFKFFEADADPGIFLTLDPGWKKFGPGINVPDQQYCLHVNILFSSMQLLPNSENAH
jgi:hypothetical protein